MTSHPERVGAIVLVGLLIVTVAYGILVTTALSVPLPVTDIEYTVRMDGIFVGRGEAGEQMLIPTGETRTLEASTYVDSSRLDEWWMTHLRNDEMTWLSVSFDTTIKLRGVKR